MKDTSIHNMTQRQLKKKLAELKESWERTSTYGSPWGTTSTKAELYDLEQEMAAVSRLINPVKIKPKTYDSEIDEVYNAIDALMREGCWKFLNELFVTWEQRVWRMDIDILLAYATASFPGKSNIPARKMFMDKCLRVYPDKDLWKGLE
jgi:hypothetical protein